MARFNVDDYISVQERINRFWTENPEGRILTALVSPPDDFQSCRYRAEVYLNRDDARPVATGWAFEHAGGNSANATSHEENCETSAIGRALANYGYATSQKDRPSREEMSKANRAQDAPHAPQTRQNAPQGDARPHEPARPAPTPQATGTGLPATDRQFKYLRAVAHEVGVSDADLEARCQQSFGHPVAGLNRRNISALIEQLQAERVTTLAPANTAPSPTKSEAELLDWIDQVDDKRDLAGVLSEIDKQKMRTNPLVWGAYTQKYNALHA